MSGFSVDQTESNVYDNDKGIDSMPNIDENGQLKQCNPWSLKYALIWYVFLIVISIIISIVLVVQAHQSQTVQQTNSGFFIIVVSLVVAFLWFIFVMLVIYWMYKEAKNCKTATTWLVFLIALLLPIIINIFFGLLGELL